MVNIVSSSESSVSINGSPIEGVQSIEYKVVRNVTSNFEFNSMTRTSISYGNKIVTGTITVKSHNSILDQKVHNTNQNDAVNLTVVLKQGSFPPKELTFVNVIIENRDFNMDVGGVGVSVYSFSASDLQGDTSS